MGKPVKKVVAIKVLLFFLLYFLRPSKGKRSLMVGV